MISFNTFINLTRDAPRRAQKRPKRGGPSELSLGSQGLPPLGPLGHWATAHWAVDPKIPWLGLNMASDSILALQIMTICPQQHPQHVIRIRH